MKNIIDICKDFGLGIPADKQADFNRAVAENYKTVAEFDKRVSRLETERDAHKERADTAEAALKGFEGIDPADLNNQIEKWKEKADQAEKNAAAKLAERDFEDALKNEMERYRFTSNAAKRAVMEEIKSSGAKLRNGKIMGFDDLIQDIRKNDASAFVDDHQEQLETNKPRFTSPNPSGTGGANKLTRADIMGIKDPRERQNAIAKNLGLFQKEND